MKKIYYFFICLLISFIIITFNNNSNAQYNYTNYIDKAPVYHRINIISDDTAYPTEASGVDCTGYSHARIYLDFTTTEVNDDYGSWDITPLYWNSFLGQYHAGTSTTVTGLTEDRVYTVAVDGEPSLFIYCNESSGLNPEVDVYVQPFNRL